MKFFKSSQTWSPLLTLGLVLGVTSVRAEKWQRIKLYDGNNGEAGTYGDFNHDGKMDVAAGTSWWEGPGFTVKHTIGTRSGTALYPYDFNGDGWTDLMLYSGQGGEGYMYINPKTTGTWTSTKVLAKTDGENPDFLDVTGDGKPEAFVYQNRKLGWYEADWSNPTAAWKFVSISPYIKTKIMWCHGYGFGDVNMDGRPDVLEADGWWENPPQPKEIWTFHAYAFGYRNGIKYFPYEDFLLYGPAHMYAYDVNKDGKNDIVSSVDAHGWGLAWYEQLDTKLADGSPDFLKHMIINTRKEFEAGKYPAALSQMHAVLLRDVNEDGLLDIVTGKRKWAHGRDAVGPDTAKPANDPEPAAPGVIYWFELKREGGQVSYIPHLIDSASGVGTQFEMGDLDGDGHLDVIEGNQDGANVVLQKAPFPTTSLTSEKLPRWRSALERGLSLRGRQGMLAIAFPGPHHVELIDLAGQVRFSRTGTGPAEYSLGSAGRGTFLLRVEGAGSSLARKVALLQTDAVR
jgi:hypothetical protein